jgi:hypothetical protein
VTAQSAEQSEKQRSPRVWIDAGIQIDCSPDESANAESLRAESRQPASKTTLRSSWKQAKQPGSIRSKVLRTDGKAADPKYRTIESPSKLVRKSSETFRNGFIGSMLTVKAAEVAKASPFSWATAAGRQIDPSRGQLRKAESPIDETLLPRANEKLESLEQPEKQNSEIAKTDDGRQTD